MPESSTSMEQHSNRWIQQRIDVNKQARFGLEDATPQQLNVIFLLARRWKLDPVTDLTLMQGKPWVTIEGHMRRMREHPDYRGLERRPLTQEEKVLGGWNADDVVWQTSIKTAKWGIVTEWGKVTRAEIDGALAAAKSSNKRAAPIGLHAVEIAQKRSLARANRLAFGMDAPDEEEIEREVAEEMAKRNNPVSIRENAATYDRIYGEPEQLPAPAEEDSADVSLTDEAEVEEEEEPANAAPAPPDPWIRQRELYFQASNLKLRPKVLRNDTPRAEVEAYNEFLEHQIEARLLASSA
jgi:hypothetical protein